MKNSRTLLTKAQKADFLKFNQHLTKLRFVWTTDQNTGYNRCSLKDANGQTLNSNAGGGYDMKGTALGNFINTHFNELIKKLPADRGGRLNRVQEGFYGLIHYNKRGGKKTTFLKRSNDRTVSWVDGGCGFSSMERILNKIGFSMKFTKETKNTVQYVLTISKGPSKYFL
jgi:hypothetical protein